MTGVQAKHIEKTTCRHLVKSHSAYLFGSILKSVVLEGKKKEFSCQLFCALSLSNPIKPVIEKGTEKTRTLLFNINTGSWMIDYLNNSTLILEVMEAEKYLK